ncbi:hypothetical protein FGG08_004190 [Glutinoglossum americanum]|uniref:Polyprenal reductase n=1 Tax=Glutinoglossum americanum TaxID=1670608 RepID=A0A9P8IBX1_9PEZI|nr:hypothetical protein FGG08_004190 [Glutinoglossum americanum]
MEPTQALRGFFLLATSTVLFVNSVPPLRSRFLAYGSRSAQITVERTTPNPKPKDIKTTTKEKEPSNDGNPLSRLLDAVASIQVPHSWFTHFYLVSVASSLFWAVQILTQGRVFNMVLSWQQNASIEKKDGFSKIGMTLDQITVVWTLMMMQGARRLYESTILMKPSQSTMGFMHWVLGVGFYMAIGIAIWVEGIREWSTRRPSSPLLIRVHTAALLRETPPTIWDIGLAGPSIRTLLCITIFLFASGVQHDCHRYLTSLEKYTLPDLPIFRTFICPHYTAECLIYLSLAILAAPEGSLVNATIFTALVFTTVNLGVTAELSREWYAMKFGEEKIEGRWRMIPFIH